ncbi:SpaH/EbpB family LPXTG-anchored major pilin [Corynebacterium pelargi]|uniref:Fimbrial subunit type 1 n=1 Tax=Corynebacterium pelargi TaxID=1471400 RepID=A0A410WBK1_9CORY|nr:SpaH/EbpB family LPXTG-anchored major pilin [Corynebacterium pelargi]QAU53353.1 Fimbrial subunit type 1 precursor [Corynebacterium pelargi]GGG73064.1 hypothetical protein GCM10007338_07810 [Corynebacterium pelargi]
MTTLKHRWAAALAAGAIAVTGAGAGVTLAPVAAYAQETATPNPTGINQDNGTLHIHKFVNESGNGDKGLKNDGTQVEGVPGDPVTGARFKIERVSGIDLKTNEGWKKAAALQGTDISELPVESEETVSTVNGEASKTLPVGLYRVTEVGAPAGVEVTTAPFLVTLPMTNPTNNSQWMYDVHVYPKNKRQEDPILKTVNDENATTVGNKINYEVTAKIPQTDSLKAVSVTDVYPSTRLENPTVSSVELGDGTELAPGDYNLNIETDGEAKVILTSTGLDKLRGLNGEQRTVVVNYTFDIKKTSSESDKTPIKNNAKFQVDTGDGSGPEVEVPEEKQPETFYGDVNITKKGDGENIQATFDLYKCSVDQPDNPSSPKLSGDPIQEGITTTGGTATVTDLHVNDWVNGETGTTTPNGYCLVETQTADDYALLAEPYYFQVKKGGASTVALSSLTVENVKNNAGFKLPLTGGTGVTMLLIIGGLIMAGGALYMVRNNRRENKA